MARRSPVRTWVLLALVVAGLAVIGLLLARPGADPDIVPMDIEWAGDVGYATLADGRLVRLMLDSEAVGYETLAEGLAFPRGLAVTDDAIFVAELGPLPCENPVPRCKGEHVGPSVSDGERELLAASSGRVLAYPIHGSALGEPRVLVDDLSFVNTDHGLNDLEIGPDGMLYLSIGNLDRLAWDDVEEPPEGPETELLGSVVRIDLESGELEVVAHGFRNVYGLAFDESGTLWGVDNDGRGRGSWRFEELERIEPGLDFGFPDDGTVGPYERRTGFATWIMPSGAGSSGILVRDGTVISGGCGTITRLRLEPDGGDADLRQAKHAGCVTAIAALPDGRLLLGTVLGPEVLTVTSESALFGN